MKPSLKIMDFVIIAVILLGVAVVAHFTLTHKTVSADGTTVTGSLKPSIIGMKK
jgi:hypothetical protein